MEPDNKRLARIDLLALVACRDCGLKLEDARSKTRVPEVVALRAVIMQSLYLQGISIMEIACCLEVSASTVYHHLRKAGIMPSTNPKYGQCSG